MCTYFRSVQNVSLLSQMNPIPEKLVLAKLCPGTVSLPIIRPIADSKSHQEHHHTHTDMCSYTELALKTLFAHFIFLNHKNKSMPPKYFECISSNLQKKIVLAKISMYTV